MIIIDRIVAAFSAVTSNPIMHQQHRAMMVPSWSRKKLKPLTSAPGTGLQTFRSSSANLRCAGFVLVAVLPVLVRHPARASPRVRGD